VNVNNDYVDKKNRPKPILVV